MARCGGMVLRLLDLMRVGPSPDGRHKGDLKHDPLMFANVDIISIVYRKADMMELKPPMALPELGNG